MKKVRKSINQLYKFAKKNRHKINIVFFLASILFLGAVAYKLYSFPKIISNKLEQVSTRTITATPRPYTEEMRKWDQETRVRNAEQKAITSAPYVFKKNDLTQLSESYHITISTLSPSFLEPVECLVNSFNNEKPPTINIDPERISDNTVLFFANEISNHEFSDEFVYYDIDGSIKIANEGEKSKHTVTFESICRLNNIYFFAFNSYGEKTHIGGGGSSPSRFAFSDRLGDLTILEKQNSKHVELPKTTDSTLTTTTGVAYYGCRQIYAANNLEVLYGCGGGDGPASAGGLFLLNLSSKTSVEKVFCEHSLASKYATLCFNENGQVYYQKLN